MERFERGSCEGGDRRRARPEEVEDGFKASPDLRTVMDSRASECAFVR